jgi:hypothetical protein
VYAIASMVVFIISVSFELFDTFLLISIFEQKSYLLFYFFIFFTPEGTPPNPRFVFDTQSCPGPVQVTVRGAGLDLGTAA